MSHVKSTSQDPPYKNLSMQPALWRSFVVALVRSYKKQPQILWKVHQVHETSSATAQGIAINLSNKISTITIA